MTAVKLPARLAACAEFIREGKAVCDVGTDHALLPCYLYLSGVKDITACDIADGPLLSAEKTVRQYLGNQSNAISLVKSDGLDNISFAEDIIIAGMGGELIADIVRRCGFVTADTRFILQPMTKAHRLRSSLYSMGYEIITEKSVWDNGRLYTVIYARYTGVKTEISTAFSFVGKNTDREYIMQQKRILAKAAQGCKNSNPEKYASFMEAIGGLKL